MVGITTRRALAVAALGLLAGCGGDIHSRPLGREGMEFAPGLLSGAASPLQRGEISSPRPDSGKRFALTRGSLSGSPSGKRLAVPSEGGPPENVRTQVDGQKASGSAVKALATGQFKGQRIPERGFEVTAGGPDPVPPAPERPEVKSLEEARARARADLASENAHLRFVAAQEAGWLRMEEAVPALARLAASDDAARMPAITALGRIGGERAAAALARALGRNTDVRVRLAVVRALGAAGARCAVRPLVRQLRDKRTTIQIEAAWALGAVGRREAVPPLKAALARRDSAPAARVAAAAALARLGDTTGLAVLERAAAEQSPALQVFALRGMAALAEGPEAPPELRARAARSLASAVGSQHEEVWSEAMGFLVRTRPQAAVPVLDALGRSRDEVALRARVARAAWGGRGAHEALDEGMRSPSHLLRAAACRITGSLGGALAVERLARALADPSPSVRMSAVWALRATGGDGAARAVERASRAGDVPLRNAATQALAALRAEVRTRGGPPGRRAEARKDGDSAERRARVRTESGPPERRARVRTESGSPERRARVRTESGPPGRRARSETATGRAEAAGLVLEQIVTGADGALFCVIRGPEAERQLLRRGEEAHSGWRVEAIFPGGRRAVLSRGGETLELRLEGESSGR